MRLSDSKLLPRYLQRTLIPHRTRDCLAVFISIAFFGVIAGAVVKQWWLIGASLVLAGIVSAFFWWCLTRSAAAASERIDSISELLADLGHELANPVAASRASLQVLSLHAKPDDAASIDQLLDLNSRVSVLIDDLRVLARAKNPRHCRSMWVCRVDQLARQCILQFGDAFSAQRIELVLECAKPTTLICNEESVRRIITNLLSNALRHSKAGGAVRVSIRNDGDAYVLIEVEDSGHGIASEDLPYVFERFYRSKRNEVGSGLGLGLAIVKAEVEALDGEIIVETRQGEGTIFRARLRTFPVVHPAFAFWTKRHALKL